MYRQKRQLRRRPHRIDRHVRTARSSSWRTGPRAGHRSSGPTSSPRASPRRLRDLATRCSRGARAARGSASRSSSACRRHARSRAPARGVAHSIRPPPVRRHATAARRRQDHSRPPQWHPAVQGHRQEGSLLPDRQQGGAPADAVQHSGRRSRLAQTRLRVIVHTASGSTLYVRDGQIKVSIARIKSGALPGLRGIL